MQVAVRMSRVDWRADVDDERESERMDAAEEARVLAARKAEIDAAYAQRDEDEYARDSFFDDGYENDEDYWRRNFAPETIAGTPEWMWLLKPHLDRMDRLNIGVLTR